MNKDFLAWVRVVAVGLMLGLPVVPALAQSVGASIGASGTPPNANAMLDVQSPATGDGKGILVPRVTENQRTNASAAVAGGLLDDSGDLRGGAAQGLMVYQTDGEQGLYYNTSATATPVWIMPGAGGGDFKADGSVAMTGNLNLGGGSVSNGAFVGDGSGLTGIPASAVTEADPVWSAVSNAVATAIGERLASNAWAAADSTTNYASRVAWAATNAALQAQIGSAGDFKADGTVAMTGNLNMGGRNIIGVASNIAFTGDEIAIGKNATADYGNDGVAIGSAAHGDFMGAGVGYQANGVFGGVSVGYQARSYYYGVAMGYQAFATNYGTAIGQTANAMSSGAAVGASSKGYIQGAALGASANGAYRGSSLGYYANAVEGGIAIGYDANGLGTNIAIGFQANACDTGNPNGGNRIAIGWNVTNLVEDSCRIRGNLYLDGATNVMVRPTFNSGAWTTLGGGGGISSYGYCYDMFPGGQVVAGGADVILSFNGPLNGITHTGGTTPVTVPNAGTYKVEYSVSITAGIGAQMAIAVNGTVDLSTALDILVATGNVSGTALLTLAGGDVLTIRNNGAVPFTTTSSPGVGVQLTVTQLN